MYQIFKYVAEHGMNIEISYNGHEDTLRIFVLKDTPDRHFRAGQVIFRPGSLTLEPNQVIFNTVVELVEQLEKRVVEIIESSLKGEENGSMEQG